MIKKVAVLLCLVSLSACCRLSRNQVLVVPPSDKPTTVVATSNSQCQDFFFFMRCTMALQIKSSDGQIAGAVVY
jgi:hypothetical protein